MDSYESNNHSFIVKIWREGEQSTVWRGQITHVSSGDRGYLRKLDDIILFILPYLTAMEVKISNRWRLTRLLSRSKKRTR